MTVTGAPEQTIGTVMTEAGGSPRAIAEQLLATVDPAAWQLTGGDADFRVSVAGTSIAFDASAGTLGQAFEQLAFAVEARIAFERASAMLAAAPVAGPLPLWLVSGSTVLAAWLGWAGTGNALRKTLNLTGELGLAPVAGYLDRRARRELGRGGGRIRVRGGMAVAERIELSDRPRCVATIGDRALIRIEDHRLPDALITGLRPTAGSNTRRRLAEVVSHPFFPAADLRILDARQEGATAIFEIDHLWMPLEPVPDAARSILPRDADPAFPWRTTAGERRRLDGLIEEARHRVAAMRGPR